ncbi:MAG TPA: CAP domain-containing protein [Dehalococcoidia bacterium]|nr:CAP domain-containing protein [Dehalococcoidia bacterium]
MFQAHNAERSSAGVAGLSLDARLVAIARERAQNMAAMNCFAHEGCGPGPFTLLNAAGYSYSIAGENIARNNYPDSQTVDVAMTGFMNSPGHRSNILDARYTKVGIGVAVGANGMKYFAVVFAG